MDKNVDTFEQNKRFLSASFRNFRKNIFFVDSQLPLSPFSMLQYAPWTLSPGYNIEKERGGGNVKIRDWKTRAFNETGFFRGVSQLLLSVIVGSSEGLAGPLPPSWWMLGVLTKYWMTYRGESTID